MNEDEVFIFRDGDCGSGGFLDFDKKELVVLVEDSYYNFTIPFETILEIADKIKEKNVQK